MKLLRYQYPLSHGLSDLDRWFRSPSEGFGRLFDLAERLSGPAFSDISSENFDLFENDDHYFVRLEIPGVKKEDLTLELHDRQLAIEFQSRLPGQEDPSRGKRVVSVPEGIDSTSVSAKLEDGILTVTLPKSPETKPISVQVS